MTEAGEVEAGGGELKWKYWVRDCKHINHIFRMSIGKKGVVSYFQKMINPDWFNTKN